MHLQKTVDSDQPAQSLQADLSPKSLLLVHFLHVKGPEDFRGFKGYWTYPCLSASLDKIRAAPG